MSSFRSYNNFTVRLILAMLVLALLPHSASAQKTGDTVSSSTIAAFKEYVLAQASKEVWGDPVNWERLQKIEKFAYELNIDQIAQKAIGRSITSFEGHPLTDPQTTKVLDGICKYRDEGFPVKSEFERAWFWIAFVALHIGSFGDQLHDSSFTTGGVLSVFQKAAICSQATDLCVAGMKADGLADVHDTVTRPLWAAPDILHTVVICYLRNSRGEKHEFFFDVMNASPGAHLGEKTGKLFQQGKFLQVTGGIRSLIQVAVNTNGIPLTAEDWCLEGPGGHGLTLPATKEGMQILKDLLASIPRNRADWLDFVPQGSRKYIDPSLASVVISSGQEIGYLFNAGSRVVSSPTVHPVKIPSDMIPQVRVLSQDEQGKLTPVTFLDGISWFRNIDLGGGLWEMVATIPVPGKYVLIAYCASENDIWKLDLRKPLGKQELRVTAPPSSDTKRQKAGP